MPYGKLLFVLLFVLILPGCTAIPFGLGLIPGAPAYLSSVLDNGPLVYETAVDERSTRQQMLDAVIAGHAQAELYKHKEIRPLQITAHCYFGKLYLVGEYDSQTQLQAIHECMETVEGKRAVISRLYLKKQHSGREFVDEQATWAQLETQLLADFEVTSACLEVEIVQGNIVLLGVVSDKEERDRIVAHAREMAGDGTVVSYLYHQEIAGPAPRPMLAELPKPKPIPAIPVPTPKPKKRQKVTTKKPKQAVLKKPEIDIKQSVASNTPSPPIEVNGRHLGL